MASPSEIRLPRIVVINSLEDVKQSSPMKNTPKGQVIVTEHLRDTANFIAYNIGFLHFHSKETWLQTFRNAGFKVFQEIKITPFISTFILTKNGIAS